MTDSIKYVIITPARNEQDFIAHPLESMVSQKLKPMRWVIVNDGSTDRTKEIIDSYAQRFKFIRLVNLKRDGNRNFSRKAAAFHLGMAEIQDLSYEFIGNMDADISVAPNYYQKILNEFAEDQKLGIAGGIVYSRVGNGFYTSDEALHSVGGAVQLFRRACFNAVGGYPDLELGGIDAAAEFKARMLGWKVRKFPSLKVYEHRQTGCAEARPLQAKYREGKRFYTLGYGVLFYFMRCVYRVKDPPLFIGSLAALWGFMECLIRRRPVLLDPDIVVYLRNEQRKRMMGLFKQVQDKERKD